MSSEGTQDRQPHLTDRAGLPGPPDLPVNAPLPDLVPVLVRLGADEAPAAAVQGDLLVRWGEPHRTYHDTRHLAEVLHRVDALARHAEHPDIVRCAAWWHDAVHDGRAGDDERASAALASEQLRSLGVPRRDVEQVASLVLLTIRHDPGDPADPDGAVLCDADLGVLASGPQRYEEYAVDVRAEYGHVEDTLFRAGRSAVLRRLLAQPRLFRTPAATAWEPRARANVSAELERLAAAPR